MREVVEDAAADGAVWIEPQVNPPTYEDDPGAAHLETDQVNEGRPKAIGSYDIGFSGHVPPAPVGVLKGLRVCGAGMVAQQALE